MRFRQAAFTAMLIAGLVLSGCGAPDDLAGQLPPNEAPTPTLVPTSSASSAPSPLPTPTFVPGPSDSPTPNPRGYPAPSPSDAPTPIPTGAPAPGDSSSPSPSSAPVGGHPIAREIADEFGVPVGEVESYHSAGIGYGMLAQFYSIATSRCVATASYTVDQLVAMQQSGMGMGEIRKQVLGSASGRECSLGRLKQSDLDAADATVPPGQAKKAEDSAPAQQPTKDKPASPAQPAKKPTTPKPPKPNKPAPKDNGGGKDKK